MDEGTREARPPRTPTTADVPNDLREGTLDAHDVTDGLLLAAAAPGVAAARIERRRDRFELSVQRGAETHVLGYAPGSLGEAVLERMMVLARVRRGAGRETLGRFRVRLGSGPAELLLVVQDRGAELRRLSGALGPPLFMLEPTDAHGRIASYVLESVLGRGGMGVVYRAVHEWLGTEVAIKVLRRGRRRGLDATRAALFVREAWTASRVKHPGVVQIIDAGMTEDRAYLVMELVEFPTLRDVLREGTMGPADAARMGASLCVAVDAIHRVGVVHCDLKPENVFVSPDGGVKVSDFGAAWMLDERDDRAGGWPLFATPEYLAPEVARGGPPTRASDIYSIGCVLYEAITGEPPVQDTTGPRASGVMTCPAPSALAEIVRRALASTPQDRFRSAAEMGRALDQLAQAGAAAGVPDLSREA